LALLQKRVEQDQKMFVEMGRSVGSGK